MARCPLEEEAERSVFATTAAAARLARAAARLTLEAALLLAGAGAAVAPLPHGIVAIGGPILATRIAAWIIVASRISGCACTVAYP